MESFIRYEDKYFINTFQKDTFLEEISAHIQKDIFPEYDINNIYYDSKDFKMIKESINTNTKFKQKLRARSYGDLTDNSKVFLEIKKKYKQMGEKRRIELQKNNILLADDEELFNSQIGKEIKNVITAYDVSTKVFISYHREAFSSLDKKPIRITFDTDIKYRTSDIDINSRKTDSLLKDDGQILLEIKQIGQYPIWLLNALNNIHASKVSFSKYGTIYKKVIANNALKEV